jgi:hypothetical protein
MLILYRLLLGIDALVAAVIVYFFFEGLADGTVSSSNMGLWMATLAAPAVVLGGGLALNARGRRGLAVALLAVLAAPGLLFGLFVLAMIVLQPDWR